MTNNFIGVWDNTVSHNRITIPAKFKKAMNDSECSTIVVSVGQDNHYLILFPLDYWNEMKKKFQSGTEEQRRAMRSYLNYADEQEMEKNGRIRVKNDVLTAAKITNKDIVIKGEGNYITVWDKAKFNDFREKMRESVKDFKETDLFL